MFRNLEAVKGLQIRMLQRNLGFQGFHTKVRKNLENSQLLKLKLCASFSNVNLTISLRQKNSPKCWNTQDYIGYMSSKTTLPLI